VNRTTCCLCVLRNIDCTCKVYVALLLEFFDTCTTLTHKFKHTNMAGDRMPPDDGDLMMKAVANVCVMVGSYCSCGKASSAAIHTRNFVAVHSSFMQCEPASVCYNTLHAVCS